MIKFTLPRAVILNANQRLHWGAKAQRTKTIRTLAFIAAKGHPPVEGRVRAIVRFVYSNRIRPRDPGNLAPTAKSAIDGLTDARIWPDDNSEWVEGPDIRINPECDVTLDAKSVRVTITLEPAPEAS